MEATQHGQMTISNLPRTGLTPWYRERHMSEQRDQFFRLLGSLPRARIREMVDVLHFLLWRQDWSSGLRRIPGQSEIRGALSTFLGWLRLQQLGQRG